MQYHAKQYYTLQYHAIACHTVELILTRRIRDSYYCSVTEKAGLTHYPTANTLSNHCGVGHTVRVPKVREGRSQVARRASS